MKWSDLTKNQRIAVYAGAGVLLVALLVGAYAVGRAVQDGSADTAEEPTGTVEATKSAEATPATDAVPETPPATPPATTPETEGADDEPGPEGVTDGRVFGQLKGIRDESGGAWTQLWVDVDTATFLSGDAALDWLIDRGDEAFYNANYWYARSDGTHVYSYRIRSGALPAVWMYTWPVTPAPGFYGPGMDKQVSAFGEFYDAIYMNEDMDQLLGRYYWLTLAGGYVTVIEEQPRDPYYEP